MTSIMLHCELCNKNEFITQIYLDNLTNSGYNLLLCARCFAAKLMKELLK
jgi:hypothetical protein